MILHRAAGGDRPYRVYRSGDEGRGSSNSATDERPYKTYRAGPPWPARTARTAPRGMLAPAAAVAVPAARMVPTARAGADGAETAVARPAARPGAETDAPSRVLKWIVLAIVAWLALSFVLFMVSASTQSGGSLPDLALNALHSGSNMITGTDTVLVLGTDQRPKGTHEAGANTSDKGSRSDTIMLWRVGGGVSRRLSIPRDTVAHIPGFGSTKINAAYAYGGPALAIKTIEGFTGVTINHLIVINLANFPKFIDAIGGIDVTTGRICSTISGGAKNGGFSLFLRPGTHHADGHPGPDAGPDARERLQRRVQRPDPRGLPAEDPQRDQVQAALPEHVLPPAVGRVGRARDGADRHGRVQPAQPVRRGGDGRLGPDPDPQADRRGDAARR